MKKAITVIIALVVFAMLAANTFAMADKFGWGGLVLAAILDLMVIAVFVNSKTVDKWIDP
jgi:hypothetical protein